VGLSPSKRNISVGQRRKAILGDRGGETLEGEWPRDRMPDSSPAFLRPEAQDKSAGMAPRFGGEEIAHKSSK
jgi:hypothetical protein